ncbi:NAD(P)-dependent alcohol dehydrogenase [Microbacterium sp. CJ88]|uniref:NAD(P)-dependent alcohol dehydrogenase n=1 Tax=Microbacterium sp. CJ88 TaxID=3445672 RepID=UPI003F65F8D7
MDAAPRPAISAPTIPSPEARLHSGIETAADRAGLDAGVQSRWAGGARIPATMTAWRQREYGEADVLRSETVRVPTPGRGEVLVRFEAASINSGDVHLLRGDPRMVRLFSGLRRPRVAGRGIDLAGTVVALGEGAEGFAVGDAVVCGWRDTLAEYVTVPARRLAARPAGVDAALAATLPVSGATALAALDACRVGSGSRVLVIGAGGGVGTITVQLAADRGAEVWATCGARAEHTLRDLGAARTFDYRTTDLAELPAGTFDAVIDIAGEPPLPLLRALLRPRSEGGGTVALVGGEGGGLLGPIPRMLRAAVTARPGRRFRSIAAVTRTAVVAELVALAAAGRLTPPVERTVPLADAGAAVASVAAGHTVGKVVVVA